MTVNTNPQEKKESIVETIPWKKYLIQIINKIIIGIIILILFLLIVYYSSKINPNRLKNLNPDDIIGVFTTNHIMLIILSSTLFILVLGVFIKTLFIDNRVEFGLDNFKSKRVIFLFLLVVSFISAVYVLLDVALTNIYMIIGPVDAIWAIDNILKISLPSIDSSTNRAAYAKIRTYYFFGFYIFMLIFPIFMFISLLTRFGRNKVFQKPEEADQRNKETPAIKVIGFIFAPIIVVFLIGIANSSVMTDVSRTIVLTVLLMFAAWWVYQLVRILLKGLKLTALFSYANLIIFFPLIFLFYFLPVLLWTGWDIFKIYSMNGSTSETILTELATPLANTVFNLKSMSVQDYFNLLFQLITTNGIAVKRIFQLDFVFVVGLSALAIGFAEGYSIIAIFSALFKGVSIARTGRVVTQSSPKLIVMTSRLIMLGAWMSFFWDRIVITIGIMQTYFSMYFPFVIDLKLPRVFELFSQLNITIDLSFLGFILPISLLLIPLYYILMSSFKFLSVSIIVDKTKNDQQIFFLLISAAFVLISTNILQDITASVNINLIGEKPFLPTSDETVSFFIAYANKLFEFLESISFFVGVLVAIYFTLKSLKKMLKERKRNKELEKREKLYVTLN